MRINIKIFRSFILIMLCPFLGFLGVIGNLNRKNQGVSIALISLFSGIMVTMIPPYQDLSRRFYETYNIYGDSTTFSEAVQGHVDVIYYLLTLLIKKAGLPFYYVSVIIVTSSVFNHLSALKMAVNKNYDASDSKLKYYYIFYLSFVNIIVIALGLRMGWGVSFVIIGVSTYFFSNGKNTVKSISLLIIACLVHFAMIFAFMILIVSFVIKIQKKHVPLLVAASIMSGKLIVPYILGNFSLGGISQYAINGYVDNASFADTSTNLHENMVNYYNYVLAAVCLIFSFTHENESTRKYNSFVSLYISGCFLFSSFYIAFNRYFIEMGIYFYLISFLLSKRKSLEKYVTFIFVFSLLNLSFSTIYLQRRPIMLGEMWKSLVTPPVFYLERNEADFEGKLKYINSDGNWIGHELGK
ncbi:EpsG family protein [Tatumella sp. UBA2305]|uniref:EpsG family protein n=1 Tax=Tatumella sp. UBA2305 TaxID=1947647 RepID=UPI0025DDE60B|nr:EpsG family protein [Tatumella sp. UBA2305]